MDVRSKEIQEYIKSSIIAIKQGIEGTDFEIIKPIEFDLAVVNTKEGDGDLKIYVIKAGGRLKSEEINHIRFEIKPILKAKQSKPGLRRPNPYI